MGGTVSVDKLDKTIIEDPNIDENNTSKNIIVLDYVYVHKHDIFKMNKNCVVIENNKTIYIVDVQHCNDKLFMYITSIPNIQDTQNVQNKERRLVNIFDCVIDLQSTHKFDYIQISKNTSAHKSIAIFLGNRIELFDLNQLIELNYCSLIGVFYIDDINKLQQYINFGNRLILYNYFENAHNITFYDVITKMRSQLNLDMLTPYIVPNTDCNIVKSIFSANNRYLLLAYLNSDIILYDTKSGSQSIIKPTFKFNFDLAFSTVSISDTGLLILGFTNVGEIKIYELDKNKINLVYCNKYEGFGDLNHIVTRIYNFCSTMYGNLHIGIVKNIITHCVFIFVIAQFKIQNETKYVINDNFSYFELCQNFLHKNFLHREYETKYIYLYDEKVYVYDIGKILPIIAINTIMDMLVCDLTTNSATAIHEYDKSEFVIIECTDGTNNKMNDIIVAKWLSHVFSNKIEMKKKYTAKHINTALTFLSDHYYVGHNSHIINSMNDDDFNEIICVMLDLRHNASECFNEIMLFHYIEHCIIKVIIIYYRIKYDRTHIYKFSEMDCRKMMVVFNKLKLTRLLFYKSVKIMFDVELTIA